MAIGAALTGLGALASGIGGIAGAFRRSNNGPGLGGLVRRGKQLGLHPLAVLGSPIAGNFAVPSAGRDIGGALANLGGAASDFGASLEARREARETADRIRRQDDIAAQEAGARIRLLEAQTSDLLTRGMGGARSHTAAAVSNSLRGTDSPAGTRHTVGLGGLPWTRFSDFWPDAQWWENAYGDMIQQPGGILGAAVDTVGNAYNYGSAGVGVMRSGNRAIYDKVRGFFE